MRNALKLTAIVVTFIFILIISACGNSNSNASTAPTAPAPSAPTAMETAQAYINEGSHEEAYALLYAIENRSEEEENLFARFSFILSEKAYVDDRGTVTTNYYDQQGNRVKTVISSFTGSVETHEYTLDENGKILSRMVTSTSGYWSSDRYTYDGNTCLMESEDSYGGVVYYRYLYDNDGKLLSETENKSTDAYPWYRTYSYDSSGNLIKKVLKCGKSVWEYTYVYDSEGRKISAVESGTQYTYKYDEYGNLLTETKVSINGDATQTDYSYTYDDDGNITKQTKSQAGEVLEETNNTYDNYGNITKSVTSDGEKEETTTYIYQLIFH